MKEWPMPDEKRTAFGPIVCERCHIYPQLTDSNWCAQCAGLRWRTPMPDDAIRAALRGAVELLIELRDYPLSVLENRQAAIDAVVAEAERALREG
jgi:hypothetical protein